MGRVNSRLPLFWGPCCSSRARSTKVSPRFALLCLRSARRSATSSRDPRIGEDDGIISRIKPDIRLSGDVRLFRGWRVAPQTKELIEGFQRPQKLQKEAKCAFFRHPPCVSEQFRERKDSAEINARFASFFGLVGKWKALDESFPKTYTFMGLLKKVILKKLIFKMYHF